jgi:outer membrane lipoprotein-sorting protein
MKKSSLYLTWILIFLAFMSGWLWGNENDYKDILFKMKKRFDKIEAYQCIFEAFSANEGKTKEVTFEYFFKSPKLVRMKVLKGKHEGTVLLYKPHKVRLKLGKGLLSLFSFSYKPEHKWVTDLRGYGMHQSDWIWYIDQHIQMLELIECTFIGEETIDGKETMVFILSSKEPGKTRNVAQEKLWIDSKELIPIKYVQQDIAGKIILSAFYTYIKLNPDLDDRLFKKFKEPKGKSEVYSIKKEIEKFYLTNLNIWRLT